MFGIVGADLVNNPANNVHFFSVGQYRTFKHPSAWSHFSRHSSKPETSNDPNLLPSDKATDCSFSYVQSKRINSDNQ